MTHLLKRFKELFVGGEFAHGAWHKVRGAETIRGPAADVDYETHLKGEIGLGLVPVREDGTCQFGAIDVDVDTIDHADVHARVWRRRLPLIVCRSKSGGAHLYVFIASPGLPAEQVRKKLELWAALLGFPHSEIFPKQSKVSRKNLGNWINLPYFAGDKTTRYAVSDTGALTLEAFVESIAFYDPDNCKADEGIETQIDEMPPCLKSLSASGLPEGMRNQSLFNFGVFFRKSDPKGWQDKLQQFNIINAKPSLTYREFQSISKSLGSTRYQYMCEQSPIRELCDRTTCLKLKFGVAHKPWEETDQYDTLVTNHLRKVLTTPPRYLLEVNGHDLTLSFDEFQSFATFRGQVLAALDLVIRPMKQQQWDLQIKDLLKLKVDIEAPPDASPEGQTLDALYDFFALRDRARSSEDLLKGSPIELNDRIIFRIQDFVRYLQARRLDKMPASEIYVLLKKLGCTHTHVSVKGRKLFAWSMPSSIINEQTEEFEPPRSLNNDPEDKR